MNWPNRDACALPVVAVCLQVQKESVWDAFYRLTDSKQQISSYVFDVVRASVPRMNLVGQRKRISFI